VSEAGGEVGVVQSHSKFSLSGGLNPPGAATRVRRSPDVGPEAVSATREYRRS
jgi:hypothetical protein